MSLRAIPIRRAGNRHNLFMGGDRELVMFTGLLAGALVFSAQEWKATLFGIFLWFTSLYLLRLMAKSDANYPARSTPFRENNRTQGRQYQ